MNQPSVKIEIHKQKAEVFINGEKVSGVRGYSIFHDAGELPLLTLDLLADTIVVDGDGFIPELPEVYKPFYEAKDFKA